MTPDESIDYVKQWIIENDTYHSHNEEAMTHFKNVVRMAEREKRLVEALFDAVGELDCILQHYFPVGRHVDDLSIAKSLLPKLKQVLSEHEKETGK